MDVADEASGRGRSSPAAAEQFGPADTVYANAGVGLPGVALDAPIADFDAMFAVNVEALFLDCGEAARGMVAGEAAGAGSS